MLQRQMKTIHSKQITKDENASSLTSFSVLPFLPRLMLISSNKGVCSLPQLLQICMYVTYTL